MVIALFALAFAMIVGGLFAAILGWDIVLVERGWTMVIAGSISAASGALLLGVAAIVSRLSHIQAELMRLQANLVEDEESAAVPAAASATDGMSLAALTGGLLARSASETAPSDVAEAARNEPPVLPRSGETPSSTAAPEAERPLAESEVVPEPPSAPHEGFGQGRFFEPRPIHEPEAPAEAVTATSSQEETSAKDEDGEPEVRIPDFLVAERYRETTYTEFTAIEPEPPRSSADRAPEPETPSIAPEPYVPTREEDIFEPEPSPGASAEMDAKAEAPQAEAAPEPESGAAVIGTYNSGDNRYVMYSDGSIEAETPQGMFKFKSLDELKEFIATGEGGIRLT
jgi:hypothetical protein